MLQYIGRFTAICAVLLTGCAHETNATIDRIFINGKACSRCAESLMIDRTGVIRDDGVANGTSVEDASLATSLIESLPIERVGKEPSRTIATLTQPTSVAIVSVVYHDGTHGVAAVPAIDGTLGGLSSWLSFAANRATEAMTRPRYNEISNALRRHQISSVEVRMRGCYGTCPAYVATFNADGIAAFRDARSGCSVHASAHVSFAHVLESAVDGGVARLRPAYPVRWVDGFGARIIVNTTDRQFISDGPDETSWGPEFAATLSRLDQIVRDTDWKPPITIGRCEAARSSEQAGR